MSSKHPERSFSRKSSARRVAPCVALLVTGAVAYVAGTVQGHDHEGAGSGSHADAAHASGHDDGERTAHGTSAALPLLGGEYAFASIGEIAALLRGDPGTDWSTVDLPALREHLRDMSRVTLEAEVAAEPHERGAAFRVTSDDPAVVASIRRMLRDHGMTLSAGHGEVAPWTFEVSEIDGGAEVRALGPDERTGTMIRALGLHGLLADGDHHRMHHLMIATGRNPH